MAKDELTVDHKASADGADTKPFDISPEDLRLGWIQSDLGFTTTVELVTIPAGLRDDGFSNGATDRGAFNDGIGITRLLEVNAIAAAEVTSPLPQVGLTRGHDKGVHDQQGFTWLIREHTIGFTVDLGTRYGSNTHVDQAFVAAKGDGTAGACGCSPVAINAIAMAGIKECEWIRDA